QMIACITNFSSEPRPDHRIGLPAEGVWKEILNTDADVYDGTGGIGNLGEVIAHPVPSNGFEASASVTIPPLGAVWLLHQAAPTEESDDPEKETAGTLAAAKQASPRPTRRVAQVVGVPEDEPAPAKKAPAKKAAAKKVPAAKAAATKAPAKKAPAKKTPAKKAAAAVEETVERAAAAVEDTVEKAAAAVKKAAGKKAPAKKAAAKKSAAKKATPPPES
ncbi:MAG TPA: alpha amylase C-terminal domain-containing protein, partial [Microlunatus sp.]|nr:alpha amylase C-terminal domain-containing protein [Microlunatus sp.]